MSVHDDCQRKIDDFLESLGYWRKQIAADGSCLFRAVSEHVYHTQANHHMVRLTCVNYIRDHKDIYESFVEGDFVQYLENLSKPQTWGGHLEMHAMAAVYGRDFLIFDKVGKDPYLATENGHGNLVMLCYMRGSHYDCVYPKRTLCAAAICQSVAYDILYKDVFGLGDDVDTAVEKMLYDKTYFKHKKNMTFEQWKESVRFGTEVNALPEGDPDSSSEILVALANRIPPFPFKVAKALDPSIYRNVEFDVWNEAEKEKLRNEQMVVPELEPGVKCLVRLEKPEDGAGATFQAHVQKMESNRGPVTVFIEKLGEMCTVPFENVEALPLPAHKVLTWRSGPCKLRSICFQRSILTDLQELHRTNRKLFRKSKGRDLSFLFPRAPLPFDLSRALGATSLKGGDAVHDESRARPSPQSPCESCHAPWETVLPNSGRIPGSTCGSSQGFAEGKQWSGPQSFFPTEHDTKRDEHPARLAGANGPAGSGRAQDGSPAVQDPGTLPGAGALDWEPYPGEAADGTFVPQAPTPEGRRGIPVSYYDPMMGSFLSYVFPSPEPVYINYGGSTCDGGPTDGNAGPPVCDPPPVAVPVGAPVGVSNEAPHSPPVLAPFLGPFEPPAPGVDLGARRSLDPAGSDLPRDVPTLRWFYNIGCEYFRRCTGQPQLVPQFPGYMGSFAIFPPFGSDVCTFSLPDVVACDVPDASGGVAPSTPTGTTSSASPFVSGLPQFSLASTPSYSPPPACVATRTVPQQN